MEKLVLQYAPRQADFFNQTPPVYHSTWQLANTPPFEEPPADAAAIPLEWKQSVIILVVVAIGFPPFLLNLPIAGGVPKVPAMIFLAGWLIAGLWLLIRLLSKKPRLVIDSKGIWFCKWKEPVLWSAVVVTYIKEQYISHESSKYYLLVHGYDERTDDFFCRQVNIGNLAKDERAIAFLIEYIKQQAGYPTAPLS